MKNAVDFKGEMKFNVVPCVETCLKIIPTLILKELITSDVLMKPNTHFIGTFTSSVRLLQPVLQLGHLQ